MFGKRQITTTSLVHVKIRVLPLTLSSSLLLYHSTHLTMIGVRYGKVVICLTHCMTCGSYLLIVLAEMKQTVYTISLHAGSTILPRRKNGQTNISQSPTHVAQHALGTSTGQSRMSLAFRLCHQDKFDLIRISHVASICMYSYLHC